MKAFSWTLLEQSSAILVQILSPIDKNRKKIRSEAGIVSPCSSFCKKHGKIRSRGTASSAEAYEFLLRLYFVLFRWLRCFQSHSSIKFGFKLCPTRDKTKSMPGFLHCASCGTKELASYYSQVELNKKSNFAFRSS